MEMGPVVWLCGSVLYPPPPSPTEEGGDPVVSTV